MDDPGDFDPAEFDDDEGITEPYSAGAEIDEGDFSELLASRRRMKEYLIRLVYVEMLGHDVSFGHIHAVKMTHDESLAVKCAQIFVSDAGVLIASNRHPQTIDMCRTRADGFDLKVVVADVKGVDYSSGDVCGVLVQYPGTEGEVLDYADFVRTAHARGVKVVMATDLLALTVLKPPGEIGVDIVVGSAQRFGVPMGYGGPHAAFLATSQECKRMMPGRIIGVSMDSTGKPALRMAMQTRSQR